MSHHDFIEHFQKQGLTFDRSAHNLKFTNASEDFVDGFFGETVTAFRVWRKPQH